VSSLTSAHIKFYREADGTYVAFTGPTFDRKTEFGDNEFGAMVWRENGEIRVRMTTFGRLLEERTGESIEVARDAVKSAFDVVEVSAR